MTSDLNFLYSVATVVNAVTSLLLGLFILFRNPRSKLHQLWGWMSFAITLWAVGLAVSFASAPSNYSLSLFALRFGDTVAIFIPLLYLHFILVFLGQPGRIRILPICYGLSIVLACFGFSPLYIQGLKTKLGIINYNDAGPLFWIFFGLYIFEPLYAIRLMWLGRRVASGTRKAHITYVMAAGMCGFLVGATWFPLCFNLPIPPVGGPFVWLYSLFVAWAVFKYHLFDIQVVIRRSLVYSLLVTLLTIGYFGLVYGIERFFQVSLGYQSAWISVTAFALMALVFQPLKIWIQRLVDWLIFRAPYEELVKRMERLEREVLHAEKLKAISTLAAGMAHEIKGPLMVLKTFGEVLPEKHQDPVFVRQFSEILEKEVDRIHGLVQDVLTFARPKPPQFQPIDLSQLVNSTVDLLSADLVKRRISYVVDCQHNGAIVWADPDHLRQVLINLIQNAADAMPRGGRVSVATRATNGYLELSVSDTGRGISKEFLSKIFEPFMTTKAQGTGLGLAMVHSIIHAHHGSVQVESVPNQGTTFTVRLPL